MPTSLWFTTVDQHDDDHGYVCCSTCITDFAKWSGIGVAKWQRLHTPAQWMCYPLEAWRISLTRSRNLLKLQQELGAKAAKAVARKRKRHEPAAPEPAAAADDGSVILDQNATSQVMSAFSQTEDFLDSLLQHAHAQSLQTPVQQNVLTPPIDPAVPQNVLGPIDPAVTQNVLGPIDPAVPQNVLGPIIQLSVADTRRLNQALTKLEKLSEWIATALVEVLYVENVVRKILRR